jgi:hypothetical protein
LLVASALDEDLPRDVDRVSLVQMPDVLFVDLDLDCTLTVTRQRYAPAMTY